MNDFPTLATLILEHIPDGSVGYMTTTDCDDLVLVIRDPGLARKVARELASAQFMQSAIEDAEAGEQDGPGN